MAETLPVVEVEQTITIKLKGDIDRTYAWSKAEAEAIHGALQKALGKSGAYAPQHPGGLTPRSGGFIPGGGGVCGSATVGTQQTDEG